MRKSRTLPTSSAVSAFILGLSVAALTQAKVDASIPPTTQVVSGPNTAQLLGAPRTQLPPVAGGQQPEARQPQLPQQSNDPMFASSTGNVNLAAPGGLMGVQNSLPEILGYQNGVLLDPALGRVFPSMRFATAGLPVGSSPYGFGVPGQWGSEQFARMGSFDPNLSTPSYITSEWESLARVNFTTPTRTFFPGVASPIL